MGFLVTIFINGLCVPDPSLSVIETTSELNVQSIVSEFANFEKLFNEYEGFHEARRLLMEDDDEEIYLLKEGACSKFLEWVESIVEKFPKSADLSNMCEKSSQDTLDRSDVKFSVPSEDKELIKHKEFFKTVDKEEYVQELANAIMNSASNDKYGPELEKVFR